MLEEFFAAGKLRAIGVSNYTVRHLQELLAVCSVVPHVNQVGLQLQGLERLAMVNWLLILGILEQNCWSFSSGS